MARPSRTDTAKKERQTAEPVARRDLRPLLPVLALVVFALTLRLWGLTWGLPNTQRFLSYHPDEGVNLQGIQEPGTDAQGRLIPVTQPHLALHFYNYGGLYFYLWQGAVAVNRAYGFVSLPASNASTPSPESSAALILTGRFLSVLFGAGTVWAVFALGNRLFGYGTGLTAGALYAVIPAVVVHAHFATVDSTAVFFVTVALVFGSRLLASTRRSDVLWAGLFCGLAAACKYNAALVLCAPLVALYLRRKLAGGVPRLDPWLLVSMAVVGFFLGCPGALLEWQKFTSDFAYELHKSGEGMGLLFADTGSGWWYHLSVSLRFCLGLPLLLLSLAGVVFALTRRTQQDGYLLAFLLPYYLVIGWAQVRFLRYVFPLTTVLAVMAARLVLETWEKTPLVAKGARFVGAAVGLLTFGIVLGMNGLFTTQDSRDQAALWLATHMTESSVIAFGTTPWYYSPPLTPGFTRPDPARRRQAAENIPAYRVRLPAEGKEWDTSVLAEPLPEYVIVSDIESEDALRLRLPDAMRFFDTLKANYAVFVFENRPRLLGLEIGKAEYVPNDLLYIYPRITIYRRN